jgi:type II secretory pathway pseudopilin PulG
MSFWFRNPARFPIRRPMQGGYSLTQVVAALAILAVLASLAATKLTQYLRQRTLKGEAQALVGLMRQTRSLGIKKNLAVKVVFDRAGSALRILEDADGDGAWQSGEPVREVALPAGIAFGAGDTPPPRGPVGGGVPAEGLAGSWSTGLVFARDAMATPGAGAAYLHHARLAGWAACLIRPADSHQITAYLWDGTAWRAL